ncbi:MAG TPA: response regulator transcription factor [Ferruginibacter sp.]|nr:response regulator transcription factor [Ferruginibacter sp.]
MEIKRIILADDHSFVRLGIIQILKDEYPYAEIMQVGDAESLIKEVARNQWDLVITDLDMPGRSGLEALEQIKLLRPELPVLILSIYPEDLYAIRVLKAGASGYLNKNSAPDELIVAIQRIALGKKYITSEIAEKFLDNDSDKKPHELLSNREFEVFKLLASGKTVSQVAEMLSIALTTVSTHRSRVMEKLNLSTNSDLTRYAISNHIISDINM